MESWWRGVFAMMVLVNFVEWEGAVVQKSGDFFSLDISWPSVRIFEVRVQEKGE